MESWTVGSESNRWEGALEFTTLYAKLDNGRRVVESFRTLLYTGAENEYCDVINVSHDTPWESSQKDSQATVGTLYHKLT